MTHSMDPWRPGPTRPESQAAPDHKNDSQAPREAKAEVISGQKPATWEQTVDNAAAAARGLGKPRPRPEKPSAFARAVSAARVVLPVVQKVLPLLEGNVAGAAVNLLAPAPRPVNLEPVTTAISKLQAENRTLRGQMSDQRESLKSIEDELAAIREGLDRHGADIRELAENQLNLKRRLVRLSWAMFILLVISISFTALICVRLAYILRL
jgi:hypothetical protein